MTKVSQAARDAAAARTVEESAGRPHGTMPGDDPLLMGSTFRTTQGDKAHG